MSDNESKSPDKAVEKPLFTAKEEDVLKAAWHCLKTAPEIDIAKLMERCNFNTQKTASNTWGVIKRKLDLNANATGAAAPSTPKKAAAQKTPAKKGKATPLKRGKKAQVDVEEESDDEEAFRSVKKARKSPQKKGKSEQQGEEEDDEV